MADRPAVPDLPDLPVVEALDALRAALIDGTSAVLVAPPGAGKTTVVPLALLDQPWLGDQRIVMLEPRRLATRAAARRMSTTTRTPIGVLVGYQTRDEREITSTTRIEVVTEGVLTRRLQNDPELAVSLFERALGLSPEPKDKSWILAYLGRLSDLAGEADKAKGYYEEAILIEGASEKALDMARQGIAGAFEKSR